MKHLNLFLKIFFWWIVLSLAAYSVKYRFAHKDKTETELWCDYFNGNMLKYFFPKTASQEDLGKSLVD